MTGQTNLSQVSKSKNRENRRKGKVDVLHNGEKGNPRLRPTKLQSATFYPADRGGKSAMVASKNLLVLLGLECLDPWAVPGLRKYTKTAIESGVLQVRYHFFTVIFNGMPDP